jgi:hypothetical protein
MQRFQIESVLSKEENPLFYLTDLFVCFPQDPSMNLYSSRAQIVGTSRRRETIWMIMNVSINFLMIQDLHNLLVNDNY